MPGDDEVYPPAYGPANERAEPDEDLRSWPQGSPPPGPAMSHDDWPPHPAVPQTGSGIGYPQHAAPPAQSAPPGPYLSSDRWGHSTGPRSEAREGWFRRLIRKITG